MPRAAVKPRRTRTTRHRVTWREWPLEVRHTPDYLIAGTDHLEVIVKAPKDAPIPITSTGYRSHFLPPELIAEAGGAASFVIRWLDSEASTKAWSRIETSWRQLELELVMPKATRPRPAPRQPAKAERPVTRKSARKPQP